MIKINDAVDKLNINIKKMRYYMFTKEIDYVIEDNQFYLEDSQFELLKKIVVFRRLGFSLEDIDEFKKNKKLNKTLIKMDNLIPYGNKYESIKIVINEILKDKVDFDTMDADKYLELINKLMYQGKRFYIFSEDITYEDYKSTKFNLEYMIMITVLTVFFLIISLVSNNENAFLFYFPFFFIGLILTLFIFYIPIKVKYYKRILGLLKRNFYEK